MLITGVDEWLWSCHCFVDNYYNSVREKPEDFETGDGKGKDAPTGQYLSLQFPVWNPRQYFLVILARRMMQIASEWTNLTRAFNARLMSYVSDVPRKVQEDFGMPSE